MNCQWCGSAFIPARKGNQEKRFCSAACRQAFWSAARRWIAMALDTGLLTVANLKRGVAAVHGNDEGRAA